MPIPTKPMEVSLRYSLPLSVIMIFFATAAFKPPPFVMDGPVLSMFRNETTGLPFFNVRQETFLTKPFHEFAYKYLHAVAAMVWSVLMPLQHTAQIRAKYPKFHRIAGRVALICSLFLGTSGLWFPSANMSHSHENLFHIHTFYGYYLPFLMWPTFSAGVYVIGPIFLYTLLKTIQTARAKQFAQHRQWSVIHSISGYGISIERVAVSFTLVIGKIINSLPEKIRTETLGVPTERKAVAAIETAAFAWTVWAAYIVAGSWAYSEYTRAGTLGKKGEVVQSKKAS